MGLSLVEVKTKFFHDKIALITLIQSGRVTFWHFQAFRPKLTTNQKSSLSKIRILRDEQLKWLYRLCNRWKSFAKCQFYTRKKSRKTFVIGLKAPIILKSRKFFEKFSKNFENSKIIIKILTSGESLWYFNDN